MIKKNQNIILGIGIIIVVGVIAYYVYNKYMKNGGIVPPPFGPSTASFANQNPTCKCIKGAVWDENYCGPSVYCPAGNCSSDADCTGPS